MSDFNAAVKVLLSHEGSDYVPDDHGRGPSKYGITLATAQDALYPDWTAKNIRALTEASAADFYHEAFWRRFHLGLIDDQEVATKMLELAVNIGPGTAIRLLQRAVGAGQDSLLGPATAGRVNSMPPAQVLAGIRAAGERHYRDIVVVHPEWANCLDGWLARLKA